MLAASHLSSNVPPDYLQAPPVPDLLTLRSNRFGKYMPPGCFQTQPTHRAQQDAAGYELRRMPFIIGTKNPDLPICNKPQLDASGPCAAQFRQFPQGQETPQNYAQNTQDSGQRQRNNQQTTGNSE